MLDPSSGGGHAVKGKASAHIRNDSEKVPGVLAAVLGGPELLEDIGWGA